MTKRGVCLFIVFAVAGVLPVLAAGVDGKWVAKVPGREGAVMETTYELKADGNALAGKMITQRGEIAIKDGKVSGDEISFVVVLSFGGNEMKMLHKGKVSGDEIKFTRQREGAERVQEFTAKRAQ